MTDEYLYRAEVRRYASCTVTEWGGEEWHTTPPQVHVSKYRILKRTPQGAWINEFFSQKRFVLLTARKRFACPTEAEALESLVARKRAHLRHAQARLDNVKDQLEAAVAALGKVQRERSAG